MTNNKRTCHTVDGACLQGNVEVAKFLLDHANVDTLEDILFVAHLLGVLIVESNFEILHLFSTHQIFKDLPEVRKLIEHTKINCEKSFNLSAVNVLIGVATHLEKPGINYQFGSNNCVESFLKIGVIIMAARSDVVSVIKKIMSGIGKDYNIVLPECDL